jgi:hypothetical protein
MSLSFQKRSLIKSIYGHDVINYSMCQGIRWHIFNSLSLHWQKMTAKKTHRPMLLRMLYT